MKTLSPSPPDASPYERLGLTPAPLFEVELVLTARARALSAWSPFREERLYQPRGTQQRALVMRDAERLTHLASALSCYFEHVVLPSAALLHATSPLTHEPRPVEARPLEESFERRLCEGVDVLERERLALLALPSELDDVDALQERHRLLSKVARFEQLYATYLGEAMQCLTQNITSKISCEHLTSSRPPELDEDPSLCAQASLKPPVDDPSAEPAALDDPSAEPAALDDPSAESAAQDGSLVEPTVALIERPQGALKSLMSLQWSPRFQPLIERQLKLLSQIEAELLSFESPARSRWAHSQRSER